MDAPEIPEDAETFEGNAYKGQDNLPPSPACRPWPDDSGLRWTRLTVNLGIQRAMGPGLDDKGRYMLLLEKMADIPDGSRQARFKALLRLFFLTGENLPQRADVKVQFHDHLRGIQVLATIRFFI